MGKGIGIAALVIIIISFIVPFVGTLVAYAALAIAAIAALFGDKTFTIATTVIAAIKLFFMSPILMAAMYGGEHGLAGALLLTSLLVALPIICLLCRPLIGRVLNSIGINLPAKQGAE